MPAGRGPLWAPTSEDGWVWGMGDDAKAAIAALAVGGSHSFRHHGAQGEVLCCVGDVRQAGRCGTRALLLGGVREDQCINMEHSNNPANVCVGS